MPPVQQNWQKNWHTALIASPSAQLKATRSCLALHSCWTIPNGLRITVSQFRTRSVSLSSCVWNCLFLILCFSASRFGQLSLSLPHSSIVFHCCSPIAFHFLSKHPPVIFLYFSSSVSECLYPILRLSVWVYLSLDLSLCLYENIKQWHLIEERCSCVRTSCCMAFRECGWC